MHKGKTGSGVTKAMAAPLKKTLSWIKKGIDKFDDVLDSALNGDVDAVVECFQTRRDCDHLPNTAPAVALREGGTSKVGGRTMHQPKKCVVVYPYCHDEIPPGWHQKEFTCVFNQNQKLHIYTGNILELKGVDVIICGTNEKGNEGKLSEVLSRKCGSIYESKKKEQFKTNKKSGDIVCLDSEDFKSFKLVVQAVFAGKVQSWDDRAKRKKADEVFRNVFNEISQRHFHSMALPLIGTSTGSGNPCFIAERLVDKLMDFCSFSRQHAVSVHLVHIEDSKTKTARHSIEAFIRNAPCQIAHEDSVTNKQKQRSRPKSITGEPLSKHTKDGSRLSLPQYGTSSSQPRGSKSSKTFGHGSTTTYTFMKADGKQMSFTKQKPMHNNYLHSVKHNTKYQENEEYLQQGKQQKKYIPFDETELKTRKITTLAFSEEEEMSEDETDSKHQVQPEKESVKEEDETCVICMDKPKLSTVLPCRHVFCRDCIEEHFKYKKACPTCGTICGIIQGDQPRGDMKVTTNINDCCAGYENFGRIEITYKFDSGTQGSNHPDPGQPYSGITRTAYLPDNDEGRTISAMLKVAFDRKLVFTIGHSRTTGKDGVITWNDIHHKTDPRPNTQFGYPDPTYLNRVTDELKAKGVTADDIQSPSFRHRRH